MNKKLDTKEVKTKIADSRKELLNLRFKKRSGQLDNSSEFKKNRRNIARLMTQEKKNKLKEESNA